MAEFDRLAAVQKQAEDLADRIEFIPNATLEVLKEIRLGMFFVMAFWSGPSRQAFGKLIEVVREHDLEDKLRVIVADTDCIPEFYETPPYKGQFHGWGETFWVKDGVVISDSGIGLNLDCIKPNTLELLELAG